MNNDKPNTNINSPQAGDPPNFVDPPPLRADGDDEGEGVSKNKSENNAGNFADILYEKITDVIGGDNPNQFFCMSLPGTLLEANQYSYNVAENEKKPAFVEANESKLVNKLFDATRMTAGDNGRQLHAQYKTALDMLTPKLNGLLFKAKNKLREVLMMPYEYNFGSGADNSFTLGQVFYKLYDEYVEAKQKWNQLQLNKRDAIDNDKNFKGDSAKVNKAKQNAFLDWYAVTAPSELLYVEEKLSKVLQVFSPGDMAIITGILDSGSGREISEARNVLANVQRQNPEGGVVYPVSLYPQNWFELLDTSFTAVDLLESPAALAQKIVALTTQRNAIQSRVNRIMAAIPDDKTVADAAAKYEAANTAYDKAAQELQSKLTDATIDMAKSLIHAFAPLSPGNVTSTSALSRVSGIPIPTDADFDKIKTELEKGNKALSNLTNAAQASSTAAKKYTEQLSKSMFSETLIPLQNQLDEVEAELAALQQKINMSHAFQPPEKTIKVKMGESEAEKTVPLDSNQLSDVAPNHVPGDYMQLIISSKMSTVNTASKHESSANTSNSGTNFFFGGYNKKKSHSQSLDTMSSKSKETDIQIGMSVAKVRIAREWFNPGVFLLTEDMYNVSGKKIAPAERFGNDEQERRFEAMEGCIFPCFPVAFVIARDVTVKFTHATSISSDFAEAIEDNASKGGGLFIFSGSSSSSSSSSNAASVATSTANSVTVRFTNPQVIGYYLECTPPDESTHISDDVAIGNGDFISIFQFIEDFKTMLEDHNKNVNVLRRN